MLNLCLKPYKYNQSINIGYKKPLFLSFISFCRFVPSILLWIHVATISVWKGGRTIYFGERMRWEKSSYNSWSKWWSQPWDYKWCSVTGPSFQPLTMISKRYRVFIIYIIYCVFSKNFKYPDLWPFSVIPRCQCVYTHRAAEKSQNFKEKHNIKWTSCI